MNGRSGALAWKASAILLAVTALGVLIVMNAASLMRPGDSGAAIVADPLDEAALARLGFDVDRRGERSSAQALLAVAGHRSWRDQPVQAWLLQRAAEAGDWPAAMAHADALLRTDGQGALSPQLFRLLDVIGTDEASRPALLARLRSGPWWRGSWLAHVAAEAASPSGAITPDQARSIVISLAAGPHPLTPAEYLPYVQMRLGREDYAQAKRDWDVLARRGDAAALLRDPEFRTSRDAGPFDWSRASAVGATSEAEATAAGRALRVDYDGFSPSPLPGQLLVLSPGVYRFSWRERIMGPPRLAWRVRCLGRTPRVLAYAQAGEGLAWRARRLVFATSADCPGQQLELIPQPGERRDEVTGWFAGVSLSRSS